MIIAKSNTQQKASFPSYNEPMVMRLNLAMIVARLEKPLCNDFFCSTDANKQLVYLKLCQAIQVECWN